jgi:hypothetical protein
MSHTPSKNSPNYQVARRYSTPSSPICFTHLVEKSNEFINKFKALTEIDSTNMSKLGVYQNRLYVCWNYFQGLQRVIHGESREKLIIFLEENMYNYKYFYFKLLDMLVMENAKTTLVNIIQEHRKLWSKWICGLNTLSIIYSEDLQFIERLKKNVLDIFNLLYTTKLNF